MTLPEPGAVLKVYPAPLADVETKPGAPLRLRRVQDGAGNYGRFLPDEGAERPFDLYWHDRIARGDVLLDDPRQAYTRAAHAAAAASTPPGVPPAPSAPPLHEDATPLPQAAP